MIGDRLRVVQAFPAKKLGTPSEVGIFAISEKISVEKLSTDGDIVQHAAAVKTSGAGAAENVFKLFVLSMVGELAAAVEVAEVGSEEDAG